MKNRQGEPKLVLLKKTVFWRRRKIIPPKVPSPKQEGQTIVEVLNLASKRIADEGKAISF
jgi:hypothetical protein